MFRYSSRIFFFALCLLIASCGYSQQQFLTLGSDLPLVCRDGPQAIAAVLEAGGNYAERAHDNPGALLAFPGAKPKNGTKDLTESAAAVSLAALSSPLFRTHRDRYIIAREAMRLLATAERVRPGILTGTAASLDQSSSRKGYSADPDKGLSASAVLLHAWLKFCPTVRGESEYAPGRFLAHWAISTAIQLARRHWYPPPAQQQYSRNGFSFMRAIGRSSGDEALDDTWESPQDMLLPEAYDLALDERGDVAINQQERTTTNVQCGSPMRLRFEADQLAWLVGEGLVPRMPFLNYASSMVTLAQGLKRSATAQDMPDGRPPEQSEYLCFLYASMPGNLPAGAMPPSHGRAVYARPLPDLWLRDADVRPVQRRPTRAHRGTANVTGKGGLPNTVGLHTRLAESKSEDKRPAHEGGVDERSSREESDCGTHQGRRRRSSSFFPLKNTSKVSWEPTLLNPNVIVSDVDGDDRDEPLPQQQQRRQIRVQVREGAQQTLQATKRRDEKRDAVGWDAVQRKYQRKRGNGGLSHAVADGVLREEVCDELFAWALETTHWWDSRWGYLGSYFDFWDSPVVARLAEELQRALPEVIGGYALSTAWMYLYDSEVHDETLGREAAAAMSTNESGLTNESGWGMLGSAGIPAHADEAAVNVNIWLTPDEYNEDPLSGGLEVFDRLPPGGWTMKDANQNADEIARLLQGSAAVGITDPLDPTYVPPSSSIKTPYRRNRMVIFDSMLFHKTSDHYFRQAGFKGKRINLTLLFGTLEDAAQKGREHENNETERRKENLFPSEPILDQENKVPMPTAMPPPVHASFVSAAEEAAALERMAPRQHLACSGYFHANGNHSDCLRRHAPSPKVSLCRAAVLVSGQFRTFAEQSVRDSFRSNLLGGLSGKLRTEALDQKKKTETSGNAHRCDLDLYFCAKPYDSLPANRNEWFRRTKVAPATAQQVKTVLASEFPEARVIDLVLKDPPPLATYEDGRSEMIMSEAWLTLQSVQGCYFTMKQALVKDTNNSWGHRPPMPLGSTKLDPGDKYMVDNFGYDWVVHTRFDLGYTAPFPPLASLHPTGIHVPYTSMPVSDTFAIVPFSLAHIYFNAADMCGTAATYEHRAYGDIGETELLLANYVLYRSWNKVDQIKEKNLGRVSRFHLQDFPLSLVRGGNDSSCQAIASGKIPCMLLTNAGFSGTDMTEYSLCESMISFANAVRCDHFFIDGGRGLALQQVIQQPPKTAFLENSMLQYVLGFPDFQNGTIEMPVNHTIRFVSPGTSRGRFITEPRLLMIFEQHKSATLALREAIACLFANHLALRAVTPVSALDSSQLQLEQLADSFPYEVRACTTEDSDDEVQHRLFAWSKEAWENLMDMDIEFSSEETW